MRNIVAFLGLIVSAYAASVATPRPLADVPIQTPDKNKKINLRQYRGKVVLLVLFSTNCDDCVSTIGLVSRFQKEYADQGLQVVAAAINDNGAFEVTPFIQRYRLQFPVGFLGRDETIKLAAIGKDVRPFVPIAMFIDRKGIVQQQFYGDDVIFKDQEKAFRAITASLLKFK